MFYLDLDRERDLDLERREPPLERTGERLADFAEPRGDSLLERRGESWADETLGSETNCKPVKNTRKGWEVTALTVRLLLSEEAHHSKSFTRCNVKNNLLVEKSQT